MGARMHGAAIEVGDVEHARIRQPGAQTSFVSRLKRKKAPPQPSSAREVSRLLACGARAGFRASAQAVLKRLG